MEVAYVLIQCDLGSDVEILQELGKIQEITEVRGTYGIYDIFCKIEADSKDKANTIAQAVVKREQERKLCKNAKCRHSLDDHIRNSGTCLILNCNCSEFLKI